MFRIMQFCEIKLLFQQKEKKKKTCPVRGKVCWAWLATSICYLRFNSTTSFLWSYSYKTSLPIIGYILNWTSLSTSARFLFFNVRDWTRTLCMLSKQSTTEHTLSPPTHHLRIISLCWLSLGQYHSICHESIWNYKCTLSQAAESPDYSQL
jgi:hypothetical protein